MNALDATRKWLREECPLIDKQDRFNANYLGAETTEYTLRSAGDTCTTDVLGLDTVTCNFVFVAQLPFGKALVPNLSAADFLPTFQPGCVGRIVPTNIPTFRDIRPPKSRRPTRASSPRQKPTLPGISCKSN